MSIFSVRDRFAASSAGRSLSAVASCKSFSEEFRLGGFASSLRGAAERIDVGHESETEI